MAVFQKMKKSLKDLVIGAGAALAIGLPTANLLGCGPSDYRIRDDSADGIITEEEKNDLLERMSDPDPFDEEVAGEKVYDLDQVKNLYNDIDLFAMNEFAAHGLHPRRMPHNLKLRLLETPEELEAEYEQHGRFLRIFMPEMPEGTPAYYDGYRKTIFGLVGSEIPIRVDIEMHEFGHDFEAAKREVPAEMNRIMTELILMKLNKELGSIMMPYVIDLIPPRVYVDEKHGDIFITRRTDGKPASTSQMESHLLMYNVAYLTTLMLINKHGGDVIAAYHEMDKSSIRTLRKLFFDTVESSGKDLRDVWADETAKLFKNETWKNDLRTRLSEKELEAVVHYLAYNRANLLSLADKWEGFDPTKYSEELEAEVSYFLHSIEGASNPFFHGMVAFRETRNLGLRFEDLIETIDDADEILTPEAARGLMGLSEKVILANMSFPCTGNAYECPNIMATIRNEHVGAYARFVRWADRLYGMGEETDTGAIIGWGDDYLTRFFPDADYHFESHFTTKRTIPLVYLPEVGKAVLKHAEILSAEADGSTALWYACRAENMAKAMLEASCSNVKDDLVRGMCMMMIPDDGRVEAAAGLEMFAGSCDALFDVPAPKRP